MPNPSRSAAGAARLSLRIDFGAGSQFGPGKAELLERIAETGSISAAGRQMRMSYKRAWMLVESLNAMFREPLVDSTRGGAGGGGAVLTEAGRRVLSLYRALAAHTVAAGAAEIEQLASLVGDMSEER